MNICGLCEGLLDSSHPFCEAALERRALLDRLDSISNSPDWLEAFEERWDYWKYAKPDTMVGDKETNNHLIRTGYVIPEGGLPALGIEDCNYGSPYA